MSVPLAYLGVVIIWSTTPLAIKWSGEDVGFLFGVTGRMILGLLVGWLILRVLQRKIPWHATAWRSYVAVGLPLYGAMLSVYWGAQYIGSGLVSVIFGLTPIFTGIIARMMLSERSFTSMKLAGMLMGIAGLAWIFGHQLEMGEQAHWGIMGVLVAVIIHSLGTVWVKQVNSSLPVLTMSTGGLLVAVPLYVMTWWLLDGEMPDTVPDYVTLSIVYLGVVGSVLGAVLFYYALKHVDTGKMALLTLITPVTALWLGRWLNHEVISEHIVVGTALIIAGLFFYHWTDMIRLWDKRASAKAPN